MTVQEPSLQSIADIVNGAPSASVVASLALDHVQGDSDWVYDPGSFYSKQTNSCDVYGFLCLNFGLQPVVREFEIEVNDGPNYNQETSTGVAIGPLGDDVLITKFGDAMLAYYPTVKHYEEMVDYPLDGFPDDLTLLWSPFITVEEVVEILQRIHEEGPVRSPWISEEFE